MRHRVAAVAALLAFASGCQSGSEPRSDRPAQETRPGPACTVDQGGPTPTVGAIVLRGCIADDAGEPVGATVVVTHQQGILESLGTALSLAVSGGLCAIGPNGCISGDGGSAVARTGADGQFRLVIPARADPAKSGTSRVVIALPGGVRAETTFHVKGGVAQDVALRPMRLWQPNADVRVADGSIRSSWTDGPGTWDDHPVLVAKDSHEGTYEWPLDKGQSYDAHLLPPGEDQVGLLLRTDTVTYFSPTRTIRVAEDSLVRGAACVLLGPDGARHRPAEETRCLLADGDWERAGVDGIYACEDDFATAACLDESWAAQLDLRREVSIRDVVVAGAAGAASVQLSTDGSTWSSAVRLGPEGRAAQSTGVREPVRARYLRVRAGSIFSLTEVAAFG